MKKNEQKFTFSCYLLSTLLVLITGCGYITLTKESRSPAESSKQLCEKPGLNSSRNSLWSGSKDANHLDVSFNKDTLPETATTDVVIVGGGLAGLTTAYRLSKQGIKTVVLEAEKRVGGRIDTIQFSDCSTAEAHMEEYWEHSPAIPLLRELGFVDGENSERIPPGTPSWKYLISGGAHSSIRLQDKIYPYRGDGDINDYLNGIFSIEESNAFKTWSTQMWQEYEKLHDWFTRQNKAIIHGEADVPMPKGMKALMKISFKEYIENFKIDDKHLPLKVREWIRATVEPETAIEWDQISALDGIDEMRLFLNSPGGFGEKNYHVGSGNIYFIKALYDEAQKRGSQIQTESRVTEVRQDQDGVSVTYLHQGASRKVRAKYAVVTAPLYAIHKIKFYPELSPKAQAAINSTRFGSYVKVHYRLNPDVQTTWKNFDKPDNHLFTLLSDSPAGSIYNVSDLHNSLKSGPEAITMTLLIHARFTKLPQNGAKKPLIYMSPEEAGLQVNKAIDKLFPGFSSHILDTATYIYPTAVAYWPVKKGRSRFDQTANALRRPQNRILVGGDSTEDSHSSGAIAAAERMSKILIRLLDNYPNQ